MPTSGGKIRIGVVLWPRVLNLLDPHFVPERHARDFASLLGDF